MSFLAPVAFALAVLIPVIIAMYLLKLRRTEQVVSSVYLWRRMVRDVEANAPWQRLRRNLLLIVQLLFVAALILALVRPFSWTEGVGGQAAILILDRSASMAATDIGPNRLEAAKAQAGRLVDSLPDDVRVTVIAAGHGAEVLVASSRDRRQARLAIEGVRVSASESDLSSALELASAIAARQPDTEVIVYSDGKVQVPERLASRGAIGMAHLRYMPIGVDGNNQAISVLSVQTAPGGGLTGFVQVANYGPERAQRRLSLYVDGRLVNAYDIELPADGQRAVVVDDLPLDTTVLRAELEGGDALPLDDRAWAVYRGAEPTAVTLVTEGNLFLETGLSLFPNLQVTTVRPTDFEAGAPSDGDAQAETGGASLLPGLTILDGYVPITTTLPDSNLLFIAPPQSTRYFSVTGQVEQPLVRAVSTRDSARDETDPLLMHVNLVDVNVQEAVRVALPIWGRPVIAGDYSTEGGEMGTTSLLFAGEVDGRRMAVLAFELHRSDLPLQVAFPLLLANLTGWLAPGGSSGLPTQVAPGAAQTLSLGPEVESVRVTRPDGTSAQLAVQEGQVILADTEQLGVYRVRWAQGSGQTLETQFAVSLFSPLESDVEPAESLPLLGSGGEGTVEAGGDGQQARREWWRPLAFLALALLIAEWLIYQRATLARLWVGIKELAWRRGDSSAS